MPSGNPNIAEAGKNTRFKPGIVTNPAGVPKGTKHINTWIQELLEDEGFTMMIQEGLEVKEYKGAPIKAILKAQLNMALNSKDQSIRIKATDLLMKYGWAKKTETDLTSGGESLAPLLVKFMGDADTSSTS